jgi:hypothetical protein
MLQKCIPYYLYALCMKFNHFQLAILFFTDEQYKYNLQGCEGDNLLPKRCYGENREQQDLQGRLCHGFCQPWRPAN